MGVLTESLLDIEVRLLMEMALRYGRFLKKQKGEQSLNELIRVTQLPVIEEHLRSMKEAVDKRVGEALSMVCTEETVQSVKGLRACLNKEFQTLEEQRKEVKKAVLGPYEQFEAVYKECIGDAYKRADAALKGKVDDTEREIKRRCEEGLREYFAELCAAERVDFVRYEQAGIVVDMASAKQKTPKKLREKLTDFVAGITRSVELISGMDDAEEVLVEYKRTLDMPQSIATVQERHRRIEAEKEAQALRAAQRAREAEAVAKVEAAAPPAIAPPIEQEKTYRCSFSVVATKAQLKKLKDFMIQEGIRYE